MIIDDIENIFKGRQKAELWMQVYDFTQNPPHCAKKIYRHIGGQYYMKHVEDAKLEVTMKLYEKVYNSQDP
jgi:hypothetical protein